MIDVASNNVANVEVLAQLLDQIPESEQIEAVYGEGTFDTQQCDKVFVERGAIRFKYFLQ